jgi:MoxR-like ATPase
MQFQRFQGSDRYIVSPELKDAVNVAIALEKPLLVRGEPGTGKTVLAEAIAESLVMELISWNIKSTSKAQDGLYLYDTVARLNDAATSPTCASTSSTDRSAAASSPTSAWSS